MNETAVAVPPTITAAVDSLTRLPFEAWHFGDSIAFEAGVVASARLGRRDVGEFLRGFAHGWAAKAAGFVELDSTAPGLALVRLARESNDERLLGTCVALGEFLIQRPTLDGAYATWQRSPLREPYGGAPLSDDDRALLADPGPGVFVDCVHFDPPFFAALRVATGDERWAREALDQAQAYIELLQDAETGLFHHFHLEHSGRAHALGWGRGQGWALLGLLDVVEQLGDDRTSVLRASAHRLVHAMLRTQRADGSWAAVASAEESGDETSTSAFMAHGFERAATLGVVERADVAEAIRAARASMLAHTSAEGVLLGVSAAVWASTVDTHYHHVPRGTVAPWGQGPLVLALLDTLD